MRMCGCRFWGCNISDRSIRGLEQLFFNTSQVQKKGIWGINPQTSISQGGNPFCHPAFLSPLGQNSSLIPDLIFFPFFMAKRKGKQTQTADTKTTSSHLFVKAEAFIAKKIHAGRDVG